MFCVTFYLGLEIDTKPRTVWHNSDNSRSLELPFLIYGSVVSESF